MLYGFVNYVIESVDVFCILGAGVLGDEDRYFVVDMNCNGKK